MLPKLISVLCVLAIFVGFLPVSPFVTEAEAAYAGSYDSTNFDFVLRRGNSSWHANKGHYTNLPESWQDGDYIEIFEYTGTSNAVEIPDTYVWTYKDGSTKELPITGFYSAYFNRSLCKWYNNRVDVEYLKVGKNITYIGNSFAAYCENLKEVDFAEGSKLTDINSNTFNGCTNLERVGVNGTDKLPSGVESIGSYAFMKCYKLKSIDMSGCTALTQIYDLAFGDCTSLSSVKLPPNLVGMGSFDTFQNCTSLTSIDIPASVTYIAAYCFDGCKNLSHITFRGDLKDNFGSGFLSLRGISDNATIYVNFNKQTKTYSELLDKIYGDNGGQLGANGGVKLRAIGSSSGSPKPSVRNASAIVTLSGTDAAAQNFTYDWNDTDGDGIGGVVVINGKDTDLKLTINSTYASNAGTVYWGSNRAFVNRLGTDDYEILRGKELADTMARGEALAPSSADGATVELDISQYSSFGTYYYFPKLVNKGSSSRPLTGNVGAPVMVIYHMDNLAGEDWEVHSGANIVFDESATSRSCALTSNSAASITHLGFETPWLENPALPLENGVTEANAGGYTIRYQWKRNTTESLVGATDVAAADGGSGYAIYGGFARASGNGCNWLIPGIKQSYVDALGSGTHYFIPVVTATVNGVSYNITMSSYKVVIYGGMAWDPSIYSEYNQNTTYNSGIFRFDTTETGIYYSKDKNILSEDRTNVAFINDYSFFTPAFTNNPYTDMDDPHRVQTGARNLLISPSVTLPGEGLLDVRYEWKRVNVTDTGSNNNAQLFSTAPVISLVDIGMDKADVGDVFYISCEITAYSGEQKVKSLRGYFYITSGDSVGTQTTDFVYQNSPVFLPEQADIYIADESDNWGSGYIRAMVDSATVKSTAVYQLYRVDSPNQTCGGELICTDTAGNNDSDGADIVWNTNNNFDSYQPFWAYWKVTNNNGTNSWFAPAYSPVFLFVPTEHQVKDGVAKPTGQSVTISKPVITDTWVPEGESRTISFDVSTVNMPLVYDLPDQNSMIEWYVYEEGCSEGDASSWVNLWFDGMSYGISDVQIDLNSSGYTMKGKVNLTIANDPSASDFFANLPNSKDMVKDDAGWSAADPYILQMKFLDSAYNSGTKAWSEQIRVYYAEDSVSHMLREVPYDEDPSLVTGRMEWIYAADEDGNYSYAWREAENLDKWNYLIFSDAYDGANNVFGMPDSPAAKFALQASAGAVPQWVVTDPYTGESVVLEAGSKAVTFGPTFGDGSMLKRITVSVGSTLETVDGVPNCLVVSVAADKEANDSDYKVLVTPRAVKKDGSGKIVTADIGTTLPVTLNRLENVQKATAHVYGSAVLKSSTQKNGLPVTYTTRISNLDTQQVTYQWYCSLDNSYSINGDTPIGSKQTTFGEAQAELVINAAEVKRLEDMKATKAYYYLYIEAYNENATGSKQWNSYSDGQFELTINPNIKVLEDVSYTYNVPAAAEIYYGDDIPENLLSITVSKPEHRITQYAYLQVHTVDLNTGEVHQDNVYYRIADVEYDPETDAYTKESWNGTVTDNEDGTYTYTVDPVEGLRPIHFHDYHSDVAVTVRWAIDESAPWADYAQYAQGGMSNETITNECVLTVKSADPATLSELTMDAAAETLVTISASFAEKIGADSAQLPAVSQIGGGMAAYCRPFTVKLDFNDDRFRAQLDLEYWDMEEGKWISTGFDQYQEGYRTTGPGDWDEAGVKSVIFYDRAAETDEEPYYTLNSKDDTVYLRFAAVTTSSFYSETIGEYDEEYTGDPVYSDVFAVKRICTTDAEGFCIPAEATDAQEPVGAESLPNVYWSTNDGTTTSVTLGIPGNFSVTDGGTLSYQWNYHAFDADNQYGAWVEIPDATSDTLEVTKALFDALKTTSYDWHYGYDYITFELEVTNTNPNVTGETESVYYTHPRLYMQDSAVTPQVSLSGTGDIVAGEADDPAVSVQPKVTIANLQDMGINRDPAHADSRMDYTWYARVTGYTDKNGNTVTLTGEDLADFSVINNMNAETDDSVWIPDTLGSDGTYYNSFCIKNPSGDDFTWYYMDTSATNLSYPSVWDHFNSITVELYCDVANYDYAATTDDSAYAETNTVTVTLKTPDSLVNATGAITFENSINKIEDDGSVTLLAPASALGENFKLVWYSFDGDDYRSWEREDDGTGRLVITADGSDGSERFEASQPYWMLRVIDTTIKADEGDEGLSRWLAPVQVLYGSSSGAAEPARISSSTPDLYTDPNGLAADAHFGADYISPDGGTITYQWQRREGDNWVNIPGATDNDLLMAPYDGTPGRYDFRLVATNSITLDSTPYTATASTEFALYVQGLWVSLPADVPPAVAGHPYSVPITVEYIHSEKPTAYDWSASFIGSYTVTQNSDGTFALTANQAAALSGGTLTLTATIGESTYTASCPVNITTQGTSITTAAVDPIPMGETTEIPLTGLTESGSLTWSLDAGAPDWLSIDSATGVLTANEPAVPGYYEVTVNAVSSSGSDSRIYQLPVCAGVHDGLSLVDSSGIWHDVVEERSGAGWSYDPNTGILTLNNYSGRSLRGDSVTDPLWVKLIGTSTFTGRPDSYEYLFYYDGPVTLTSDAPAELLLTKSSGLPDTGGGAALNLDELTIHEHVTVNVDITNAGADMYGWSGSDVVLRGNGTLNINIKASGSLTYRYYYGVSDDLYIYDGANVTILVDANDTSNSAIGVWGGVHTRGTGAISITAQNATYLNVAFGWGGDASTFRHTGGTLTAQSIFDPDSGISYGMLYDDEPIYEENLYLVTRSDVRGNYSATWMRAGVDGPALITPDGTFNYTLGTNEAMETLELKAVCDSFVTWEITEGNLPDGVTFTADGYNATVSGAPTETGTFSATIKAKNSHGAYSTNFVIVNMTVSSTRIWTELGDEVLTELYMIKAADLVIESHYNEYSGIAPAKWIVEVPESAPFTLACTGTSTNRLYAEFKEGKSEADLTIDTYYDIVIKALDAEDNVIATNPLRLWIRNNGIENIRVGNDYLVDDPKVNDYGSVGDPLRYDHATATLYLTDYVSDKSFTFTGAGELTVIYDGTCVIDTDDTKNAIYIGDYVDVVFRAADDEASLTVRQSSPYSYEAVDTREEVTFIGGNVLIEADRENSGDSVWWTDNSGDAYINLVDVQSFVIRNLCSENSAFYKSNDPFSDYDVKLQFSENYYTIGGMGNDIFAAGTALPIAEVTVSGKETVVIGKTVTLTATPQSLLDDDSVKYYTVVDGVATEDTSAKTSAWSYQWYKDGVAITDETAKKLTAAAGLSNGDSSDYSVVAEYTNSFFSGSVLAESEEHTLLTIANEVSITGTAGSDGIFVTVTDLIDPARLIIAQYNSDNQFTGVEMQVINANGIYECEKLTYKAGNSYTAFLTDLTSYVPFCPAAPLSAE